MCNLIFVVLFVNDFLGLVNFLWRYLWDILLLKYAGATGRRHQRKDRNEIYRWKISWAYTRRTDDIVQIANTNLKEDGLKFGLC